MSAAREGFFPATRLDPDHPWVRWAERSVERTRRSTRAAWPTATTSSPDNGYPAWPSAVAKMSWPLSMVGWIVSSMVAGSTTGRLVSVCGAIGVRTIASTLGCTIGPPADRL